MSRQLEVFVIDDDAAVRDSLCLLLEAEGIATRGFDSAQAFLDGGIGNGMGCILADIRMPGMDGMELLRALAERRLVLPVVMMTGFADVALAVAAMKAGAMDFIEKPIDAEKLLPIIRDALAEPPSGPTPDPLSHLTTREREVFALLVDGDANKVIAFKLAISPRTVEIHRARIMDKLKARNLSDIVKLGLSLGIGSSRKVRE